MAYSSEAITIHSLHDDEDDDDQQNHHGLSRLSICSTSNFSLFDDDDDGMGMHISRLSMEESKTGFESSDGDADGELSDDKEKELTVDLTDSDKEMVFSGGWGYSNPSTPVRRTRKEELSQPIDIRKYASESETRGLRKKKLRRRKVGEKWLEKAWEMKKCKASLIMDDNDFNNSGESEGLGRRGSLCMDMDEIKACRDLGFELNHHGWMLDLPSRRISGSAMDTSSGGNSPIANWRISSPGDDPRDVKARLKVWAQAVALASTAHLNH